MAATVIFEQQTVSGFQMNDTFGCYAASLFPAPFTIEAGKSYRVTWDDTGGTFTGTPFTFADGSSCVSIGNALVHGGTMGEEPFAIVYDTTHNGLHLLSLGTETSYSIGVWLVESSGIIVKDRDGNDVTHVGAARIRTRTTDGNTREFVDAENIPAPVETTLELDFSDGDMGVIPPYGTVFEKINVSKPANLIPENIAEGINIAGIIGALTSASAGGTIKYAMGNFTGNGATIIVEHSLGTNPDFFLVCTRSAPSALSADGVRYTRAAFSVSKALFGKVDGLLPMFLYTMMKKTDGTTVGSLYTGAGNDYCLNSSMTTTVPFMINASENSVLIGSTYYPHKPAKNIVYSWIAIAGLA